MELMKREGGKRGVNIADMSEIVRCLGDIVKEESERYEMRFEHTVKGWKLAKGSGVTTVTSGYARVGKPKPRKATGGDCGGPKHYLNKPRAKKRKGKK